MFGSVRVVDVIVLFIFVILLSCVLLVAKTVPKVEFKNPTCVLNVSIDKSNGKTLFIVDICVSCDFITLL
jgi:hypothetical protein